MKFKVGDRVTINHTLDFLERECNMSNAGWNDHMVEFFSQPRTGVIKYTPDAQKKYYCVSFGFDNWYLPPSCFESKSEMIEEILK
jgi:hypothetical protein